MPIKTPYDRHLDRIDDDVFRMLLLIIPDAARKLRRGIVRTVACNEASGCGVKRTPWMLVIYALNEMVRGDDAYLAESTPFETPEYPDFTKLNGEVVKGSIERYPDFDLNHERLQDTGRDEVSIENTTQYGRRLMRELAAKLDDLQGGLDQLTAKQTSFSSFRDLLVAKGYRPTLRMDGSPRNERLAAEYDNAQRFRGDDRRAFPERSPEAHNATNRLHANKGAKTPTEA